MASVTASSPPSPSRERHPSPALPVDGVGIPGLPSSTTAEDPVVHLPPGHTPTADPVIARTTAEEVAGTWHEGCPMHWNRLRTITVHHWDYDGNIRRGAIIVREDLAADVAAAFAEMFDAHFPIAHMELPTRFGGDDVAMMAANNTSGFNCRKIVGDPKRWSLHAYGAAVDINPVENPYRDPSGKWWPSSKWSKHRPGDVQGMHHRTSTSVRALTQRGWRWGEGWDWHHFDKR